MSFDTESPKIMSEHTRDNVEEIETESEEITGHFFITTIELHWEMTF